MVEIITGLSKTQVKQVVKITSDRGLLGRRALQGLMYNAEDKAWAVCDGYVASVWLMDETDNASTLNVAVRDDMLPQKSGVVDYAHLKAWLANAKKSDRLQFTDLTEWVEEMDVPSVKNLLPTEQAGSGKIDPAMLARVLPLFERPVEMGVYNYNSGKAIKLELINCETYISPKQYGLIMGVK